MEEFCAARDLSPAIAYAINLSIDELLTNTINYGYDDGARHRIDIAVHMDGSVIVVEITDDAKPFDPSGVAQPDTDIPLEDRPVGGLGIHLVREMMDGFRYRRSGEHNIVTFTKNTKDAGTAI
ncbi:MAG: ATP-binding protein [Rhodospirillaceae bacterium]|nr:ATP-binding protein [Rhodospirillaceae bacterium]